MKRYHFRLAKLLSLREQEEELVKLRLGQAARRLEEIQQSIEAIRQQQKVRPSQFDLLQMQMRQAWLSRLARDKQVLEHARVKANEKREQVLAEFVAARQKAEVLRKLEQRGLDQHKRDAIQEADLSIDDMVQSRLSLKK